MRDLVCPICGSIDRRIVHESTFDDRADTRDHMNPYEAHYRINMCWQCGLVYSSPILESSEVNALYTSSVHTNICEGEEANVRRTMEHYYSLVRPYLFKRDRVLDIGCDIGLLLNIAREDGFQELFGIEPNHVAACVAETVPRATISREFYEMQKFPDAHFDLITLIHVIDHLVNPLEVLEKALRELGPRGVILAVVHNVQSLPACMLGERFPPFNLYHHYFFSKATLRMLFKRSGFDVLRVVRTYNCYSLRFLIQKVPLVPTPVRLLVRRVFDKVRIGRTHVILPLGNIGIIARRPILEAVTGEKEFS